jgi:hypothetical protein
MEGSVVLNRPELVTKIRSPHTLHTGGQSLQRDRLGALKERHLLADLSLTISVGIHQPDEAGIMCGIEGAAAFGGGDQQ